MNKLITAILILFTLFASAQKDSVVTDTAYVVSVSEDLKKANEIVYGKVTLKEFELIQQYNQLVMQLASQRKKKKK